MASLFDLYLHASNLQHLRKPMFARNAIQGEYHQSAYKIYWFASISQIQLIYVEGIEMIIRSFTSHHLKFFRLLPLLFIKTRNKHIMNFQS